MYSNDSIPMGEKLDVPDIMKNESMELSDLDKLCIFILIRIILPISGRH